MNSIAEFVAVVYVCCNETPSYRGFRYVIMHYWNGPSGPGAVDQILFLFAYNGTVPERWCTVTVIYKQGRRHSLDMLASSTWGSPHETEAAARFEDSQ